MWIRCQDGSVVNTDLWHEIAVVKNIDSPGDPDFYCIMATEINEIPEPLLRRKIMEGLRAECNLAFRRLHDILGVIDLDL